MSQLSSLMLNKLGPSCYCCYCFFVGTRDELLAFSNSPGHAVSSSAFRRKRWDHSVENDGGKDMAQAEDPETQNNEGRKHDMTDCFKYKVNALMGTYDPQNRVEDERQDGNILEAMLNFPVRYTFNAVGKTNGDETSRDEYVKAVKKVVLR